MMPSITANNPSCPSFTAHGKRNTVFHIKDEEHKRKDIILRLELHPAIADSFDTAFICCLFNGIGFLGAEYPRHGNCANGDDQTYNDKQNDVNPLDSSVYIRCVKCGTSAKIVP